MAKGIRNAFVAIVFVMFSLTAVSAAEKYGFVDISKVFDGYAKTKNYDKTLEKEQKAKEKERDVKETEIKKLEEKISLLSEDKKAKQEKTLEKKRQGLYEFMQEASVDLRKTRDERIKEILLDIQDVIDDYAKTNKYTFIFNDRVLLYANKSLDITKEITKTLNTKYKKKK